MSSGNKARSAGARTMTASIDGHQSGERHQKGITTIPNIMKAVPKVRDI